MSIYKIKLQQFEGPLDLLLFFIKRDEIDIYDIPISKITKDFFDYLNIIKQLDLEIAGDFILMASTLMQIKVKMLLPREINEKGEEIDPRDELVKALLEYKRYKEMSEELVLLESDTMKLNFRGYNKEDPKENPPEFETLLKNITIFDLIKAFKTVLEEKKSEPVHKINKINVSIEEQVDYLMSKVADGTQVLFINLIRSMKEKIRIIVTFIAMLELVKMGRIGIKESENFNDFVIYNAEING